MKRKKTFTVMVEFTRLLLNVEVAAVDLDDALAQAKGLKISDVLEPAGELIDNEGPRIVGVYE